MNTKPIHLILVLLLLNLPVHCQAALRGIWVWSTSSIISSTTETNKLINQCKNDNIEHLYIYSYNMVGGGNKALMQTFIAKATCNNIKVWAMDGYRGYFSDWGGSTNFINFVNAVVSYNNTVAGNERFYGIHADNEPQDGQGEPQSTFHNGIKDSDLSTTPGSGVWQSTEKLDREYLMRDWISLTQQAYTIAHNNCMLLGQAMPSWLDDYYGEAVYCTYNSTNKRVMEHIMQYMDHYCIMSYNTTPANVINRCVGELTYANSLPAASRPLIWAGLETHCGVGSGISYCDTPGKNSKSAFWTDVTTIESTLTSHASYVGMNIHDWNNGWMNLSPVSSNTSDPGCINPGATVGCPLPVQLMYFDGTFDGTQVTLSWATASESNSSHFEIQKSINGTDFIGATSIPSAGNTATITEYEWIDTDISIPTHYYRLIQFDTNGDSAISSILMVNTSIATSILIIPPVEPTNELHIISDRSDYVNLEFVDLTGKVCYSENLLLHPGTTVLQPYQTTNQGGVYLIRIISRNYHTVTTRKVILPH